MPIANMPSSQDVLRDKLLQLQAAYVREYPGRVRDLQLSWQRLNREEVSADKLAAFHRLAHSLKGSGATYGFRQVSDLAMQLEAIAAELERAHRQPDHHESEQVGVLLDNLNRIQLNPMGSEIPGIEDTRIADVALQTDLILVRADAEEADHELLHQLDHFGYRVIVEADTAQINTLVVQLRPIALLAFAASDASRAANLEMIRALDSIHLKTTVILLSNEDNLDLRLQLVRAGGHAFLGMPADPTEVVDTLDELRAWELDEPYRVLVVEDNRSLADFYATTLKSAGMQTRVVTDPMQVLDVLGEFNPELILMDVYMPECDGQELARVIRQFKAYVSMPIVFLSAEKNINKQMMAMQEGGDDFLTKPIEPMHLISAVSMRADRYRKLRSLMVRDSLTGLYNHTKTKELLELELARLHRTHGSMVFAMLDIDHFKSVNDTHGHPAGDRVIRSLARLLRQRVRKYDAVGRFGGEEFAVILYDVNLADAARLMDTIREHYASLVQRAGGLEFEVTFSCGLADFPSCVSTHEIIEAADQALYRAKQAGRNRVEAATRATEMHSPEGSGHAGGAATGDGCP